MTATLHLQKLSVGTESVENLAKWQADRRAQTSDGLPQHITRMWPKREAELLNGGSIYWVFKGLIQCRQTILRLDEMQGSDGLRRCSIVLDPQIYVVAPSPKRPFQGWRYLKASDAPPDLHPLKEGEQDLPAGLSAALAEIGVL